MFAPHHPTLGGIEPSRTLGGDSLPSPMWSLPYLIRCCEPLLLQPGDISVWRAIEEPGILPAGRGRDISVSPTGLLQAQGAARRAVPYGPDKAEKRPASVELILPPPRASLQNVQFPNVEGAGFLYRGA